MLTKIEALEKCLIDWSSIAKTGGYKMELPLSEYGVDYIPAYECFCCEYTYQRTGGDPKASAHDKTGNQSCSLCPLNGYAWLPKLDDFACEDTGCNSIYKQWFNTRNPTLAWDMVEAIEKALAYNYLKEMNE